MKTIYQFAFPALTAAAFYAAAQLIGLWLKNPPAGGSTAKKQALNALAAAGLRLFADAERIYGAGTGPVKMSYVLAELTKLLPAGTAASLDADWLREKCEDEFRERGSAVC
jgi:hypothetical protein